MNTLFLQLLREQPTASVLFGGCAKNGKDGSDGKEGDDALAALLGVDDDSRGFSISGHRRRYRVLMKERRDPNPIRPELREGHLAHIDDLTKAGTIAGAGVYSSGGQEIGFKIIIAESKDEAERINKSDPLVSAGYYKTLEIQEL